MNSNIYNEQFFRQKKQKIILIQRHDITRIIDQIIQVSLENCDCCKKNHSIQGNNLRKEIYPRMFFDF